MVGTVNKLIPQGIKNNFKHLPRAMFANIKYGFPSRKLTVIGVTGTDGKTTTVNMIYQVLKDAGEKVSAISSISAIIGERVYDMGFHVTSPDSLNLQKFIKKAVRGGSKYLVLEVTSHGLDQHRFWGVRFDIGVITNITHEHLDYHKSFENYLLAKAKLIKNVKCAVLNKDDRSFNRLSKLTKGKVFKFGKAGKFKLSLLGDYNQANAQAALTVAKILVLDLKKARRALERFKFLEGRMMQVSNKRGIKIFIDFAHTPNALELALKTLREKTKRHLISVFGAASERDILKRPIMGKISGELADITILTDEDPRFEDSLKIINEIASGFNSKLKFYKEPDRALAIKLAISLAKKGDVIGIFGKGHEKSMNYKGIERSWSDLWAVKKALRYG